MLAHFSNREIWTQINQKVEEALGIESPRTSVKVYQSLHHALMEIVMGLAKQFPFKKDIFYWKGIDPYLEPVAMALAREGYRVTALTADQIQNPDVWISALNKESLMVLFPEDDPLLGKLHPVTVLKDKLKDLKVFSLMLSHHAFNYREWPKSLEKFQIHVNAVSSNLTFAILGERAKFGDWISEGLTWTGKEFENILARRPARTLSADKILNFEKQLPDGFKAFFPTPSSNTFDSGSGVTSLGGDRIFDRTVFYSEDMDGTAVIESLAAVQGVTLLKAGEETSFETPSLSRWGGLRTMDWLKAFGLTSKQIRGLVIINESKITPELSKQLSQVRSDLLKRQGY